MALPVALLALAATLACAQAQGCPSTVCDSYFAGALGGPVDCCWHTYGAVGDKCSWGGTPVSFRYTGACKSGGSTYLVLKPSNFQGPPTETTCRCKDPTSAQAAAVAVPAGYTRRAGTDVPGQDLQCDISNPGFCKVCAPLARAVERCEQLSKDKPGCRAITYDGTCAFLKTGDAGAIPRAGWTTYVRGGGGGSATAATKPAPAPAPAVAGFKGRRGVDIPANDLACDGQQYCKVCGAASAVAQACKKPHKGGACIAFTYDGGCGYLKYSVDGAKPRAGFDSYVMDAATPPNGPLALPAGH